MAIHLDKLTFSYAQNRATVLDIDAWQLDDQEHVFIHGPSGCGKSTLLNLLSGMYVPTTGAISVLGERLDKMNQRQRDRFRANHIGYVFQQFNLIPYLSALENVELARQFCKQKQQQPHLSDKHNHALEILTELDISSQDAKKPSNQLSMGQQQRIAIARALINKPEIVIADEPSSSLDHHNRDQFMALLMSLIDSYGASLVFVSHDMSLSQYFDRIESLAEMNTTKAKQCL